MAGEPDYFRIDKAAQVITVDFDNGVIVRYDIGADRVYSTSAAGVTQSYPLDQALLAAAEGDPDAAAELYGDLARAVSPSVGIDTVIAKSGQGYYANSLGRHAWSGGRAVDHGFQTHLRAGCPPGGLDCDDDIVSDSGVIGGETWQFWGTGLPPANGGIPHDGSGPYGCDPDNIMCILDRDHQTRRRAAACSHIGFDWFLVGVAYADFAFFCVTTGGFACVVVAIPIVPANYKLGRDEIACDQQFSWE